ncbi:hypothetical protein [uncultured Alistipes sp.]|uniref:hypothetical protein n=1 Tax=uncultured Alistipes sp. TaxID=538949 RepID=UPI002624624F|nr:hypothetical protein [uncultured Alistipes sp.]
MTHYITADHLVNAATQAITEELFREFDKTLQSFCNEAQDRIVIFRTLRYTRIRLHVLRNDLLERDALMSNPQFHFLDTAIGYIDTELEVLQHYDRTHEMQPSGCPHRWTGTLIELVELIYGLQELIICKKHLE